MFVSYICRCYCLFSVLFFFLLFFVGIDDGAFTEDISSLQLLISPTESVPVYLNTEVEKMLTSTIAIDSTVIYPTEAAITSTGGTENTEELILSTRGIENTDELVPSTGRIENTDELMSSTGSIENTEEFTPSTGSIETIEEMIPFTDAIDSFSYSSQVFSISRDSTIYTQITTTPHETNVLSERTLTSSPLLPSLLPSNPTISTEHTSLLSSSLEASIGPSQSLPEGQTLPTVSTFFPMNSVTTSLTSGTSYVNSSATTSLTSGTLHSNPPVTTSSAGSSGTGLLDRLKGAPLWVWVVVVIACLLFISCCFLLCSVAACLARKKEKNMNKQSPRITKESRKRSFKMKKIYGELEEEKSPKKKKTKLTAAENSQKSVFSRLDSYRLSWSRRNSMKATSTFKPQRQQAQENASSQEAASSMATPNSSDETPFYNTTSDVDQPRIRQTTGTFMNPSFEANDEEDKLGQHEANSGDVTFTTIAENSNPYW